MPPPAQPDPVQYPYGQNWPESAAPVYQERGYQEPSYVQPPYGQPPSPPPVPPYGTPQPQYQPQYQPQSRYVPSAYYPVGDGYDPAVSPWDQQPDDERRRGPRVTPFRVVIVVAMVASAAIAGYGLLVARGSQSIALTVASLAVFAISAALFGINLGAAAIGSARSGGVVGAFFGALLGGVLCLAAAGAGAAAIILGWLAIA